MVFNNNVYLNIITIKYTRFKDSDLSWRLYNMNKFGFDNFDEIV